MVRRFIFLFIFSFGFIAWFSSCSTGDKKTDVGDLKIAYNVYYDTAAGNYEVFAMNADGTGQKNISNSPGIDWVYYAYQDKIYFASDRDTTYRMYFLYEMDIDGNNIRKVSDLRLEDSYLSSRKEGRELVVSGRIGKEVRQQLFLVDVISGDYRQLTLDTAASFSDPHFSSDGKQIVFRHRTNRRNFQNEKAELWIMNDDGTAKRQLTHYPTSDTTADWHSYHAGPPFWEPNSNRISFMSLQRNNYSIFSISPDGTDLKQLTPDQLNEGWHTWSPDGNWIVCDVSSSDDTEYNIYLMKADGSESKQLTTDWRTEQAPVFVIPKK
jgi:TolB protein